MPNELPRGKIQTVSGPIEPNQLGITLCHEHLFAKTFTNYFIPNSSWPQLQNKYSYLNTEPVSIENQWYINYHPHLNEDNLDLTEPATQKEIEKELIFFKSNGGNSIVEVTTFGNDLKKLKEFSEVSKVNIVGSTGFYVKDAHPNRIASSTEELYNEIKKEIIYGVNGIKPGVIGEIGSCWPIDPFEKNVLIAVAKIQNELNFPVIIHPGRNKEAPFEIVRIFTEAGGILSKTVMSHLERTLDLELLMEFAKTGIICEFDLFGNEISYYDANLAFSMPNDATRVQMIHYLIKEGYEKRITISHDIHTKNRLMKYSGHGYSHILLNVIPKMLNVGITQKQIDQIMIQTPRDWLTL